MKKGQNNTVRLLQITDTHCYADDNALLEWSQIPVCPNQSLLRLLTHLGKRASDYAALVVSGDLVQEETAASYQRAYAILEKSRLPAYVLPGNHDTPALMRANLPSSGTVAAEEHLQLGNWHCLFLDTNLAGHSDGHLDEAQFAALEQQLAALAENQHALIFMHHHPMPVGSPWMDVMGLQQTETFWALLARFPAVKAIFFGHIHSSFQGEFRTASGHTVAVYGTPATCVQLKHTGEKLVFDHTAPAWRDLILHADGRVDTQVNYLPLGY